MRRSRSGRPSVLTRRDLVILAEFFGFHTADEFGAFLQRQDESPTTQQEAASG